MELHKTKLLRFPSKLPDTVKVAACLGNFDGIHLGHQSLLQKINKYQQADKKVKTMLLSFYPHPAIVLGKAGALPKITGTRAMYNILQELKIDYLYLMHFTKKLSEMGAREFVEDILIKKLNIGHIVIGEDARVGASGQGDSAFIAEIFNSHARSAEIENYVNINGRRISSRLIRESLQQGDVKAAASMLGREFVLEGRVLQGKRVGRTIGFPTANLKVGSDMLLPADGVYATRTELEGKIYNSVTNIGFRPTVDGRARTIETYIIDYTGQEFYGDRLRVHFFERIRDEKKFSVIEELKAQITEDVAKSRKLFNE